MENSFEVKRFFGLVMILIIGVFCISLGLAVILVNGGGTAFSSTNESITSQYNFSVNNTQATENISEVNVTLPNGFVFVLDSNATDSAATTFTNTSSVLTWVNSSAVSLVANGTLNYFWFNATSSVTPGNYNFTITTSNSTGVFETQNLSITVNDTVAPSSVEFADISEDDNANLSRSNIVVNVTADDLGTLSTIFIRLYNSTGDLVNSSLNTTSPAFVNFTGLSDGNYYFNATANDTFGNSNSTVTRTITLDATVPLIDYGSGTAVDNANLSQSNIYVNVSVTEANETNITFVLFNSTSLVNSTTYTDSSRTINWTGLSDETYTYNVTVVDIAGNSNSTSTRTINLDATTPSSIDFVSPSESDNANLSRSNIAVNVTAVDAGTLDTIIIRLYNSSGDLINSSSGSTSPVFINFTSLSDGTYYFNATANDTFGNSNSTATRTMNLDATTPSSIDFVSPSESDNANLSRSNIAVNVTAVDAGTLDTIIIRLYNSSGDLINSSSGSTSPVFINFTSLSDGTYYFNATANDTFGNSNSTATRTVVIDSVGPSVDFVSPSESDNANISRSNIVVNVTTVDAVALDTTIIRLYNSSGVQINTSSGSTSPVFINFTNLTDGTYYFNATANDSSGNSNSTATRTVVIDSVDPVVTFSCSPTSVTAGATITCTCSGTDAASGVSSTTYTANPSTSTTGALSTTCTVADYAGNSVVSEVSYTVTSASSSSGGGGYPTYRPSEIKLSEGYDVSLGRGYKVNFDVAGESHVLEVDSVSGDKVVITVSSNPVTLELVSGQTKKVDLDSDGVYDLNIYLKSISLGRANIVLTSISERVPTVAEEKAEVGVTPVKAEEAREEGEEIYITGRAVFDIVEGKGYVVVLIVLVIILLIVGIVYRKKIKSKFK